MARIEIFLYEYEYHLATQNNLQKVDWNLFSKVEKDKVTIEHILPQTPTKWYWRNQFRQYTNEEIKIISASLGNLLPLAQSINSSLQNDSFLDKKHPPTSGRRGYVKGSNSEIEVAEKQDWTAQNILRRGMVLLKFMEARWDICFSDEEKSRLLHIAFVNDGRHDLPELVEDQPVATVFPKANDVAPAQDVSDLDLLRGDFWKNLVEYCKTHGREADIASRKPSHFDWYDIPIGSGKYYIFFQLYRKKALRVGLYIHRSEDFNRLESHKEKIESEYGAPLEWYSSRKSSTAKRIFHHIDVDVYNPNLYLSL